MLMLHVLFLMVNLSLFTLYSSVSFLLVLLKSGSGTREKPSLGIHFLITLLQPEVQPPISQARKASRTIGHHSLLPDLVLTSTTGSASPDLRTSPAAVQCALTNKATRTIFECFFFVCFLIHKEFKVIWFIKLCCLSRFLNLKNVFLTNPYLLNKFLNLKKVWIK